MRLKLSHRFNLVAGGILLAGVLALIYHDIRSSAALTRRMGISEAERLSTILFDQLHAAMRSGGGRRENRAVVERFGRMQGVEEIRLVHGPSLDRQYGMEVDELPRDEFDRAGLESRTSDVFEDTKGGVGSVRHVAPLFLSRGCVRCHMAAEGAVAGVISLRLSLDRHGKIADAHAKTSLIWGSGILILTFAAVLIAANYYLLKPLDAIRNEADALTACGPSHRLTPASAGEMAETVAGRTSTLNNALKELAGVHARLEYAELTLVRMAKLASLGELGAGIAHELNSPLAGILSITELLMIKTDKNDPGYYLLENIKDAVVRSKHIIRDMLAYARPAQSGFEPLLLNEVAFATCTLFISEIKTSAIDIVMDIQDDLPPTYGNKGQIMEVFLNIIKNARDAMRGNGRIFISTYQREEKGIRYAVAEIRDTGPGIADVVMNSIFEPFFSTKQERGGLNIGLGLSISKSIVTGHNGRIEAANLPGAGAVFRVWLPLYDESGMS